MTNPTGRKTVAVTSSTRVSRSRHLARAALLLYAISTASHAGLFSDDEAREGIKRLEEQNQALQARVTELENTLRSQGLDFLGQLEKLRAELAELRGLNEIHSHDIETTQKRQRDLYVDLDTRLRQLERVAGAAPVKADKSAGVEKPAPGGKKPAAESPKSETASYDSAFSLYKAENFRAAISAFEGFINDFPKSTLAPNAQYWIGNAYFALGDHPNAILNQQKLINTYPDSSKTPDALLNIATSHRMLGDAQSEKKTLEQVIADYPISDAAEAAKKRLADVH